jgi:hypothetical protein
MWWHTPIIPASQEAGTGGWLFEVGQGKVSTKSYVKNKLETGVGGVCLSS